MKSLDKMDESYVPPIVKATPSTAVQASVLKDVTGSFPVALAGSNGYLDMGSSPLKFETIQSPATFENNNLKLTQSKEEDYKQVLTDEYERIRINGQNTKNVAVITQADIEESSKDKDTVPPINPHDPRELKKQIKRRAREDISQLSNLKIEAPVLNAIVPGATRIALANQIRDRSKSNTQRPPPIDSTSNTSGIAATRPSIARPSVARQSVAKSIAGRHRSDSSNSSMSMYQAASLIRSTSQASSIAGKSTSPDDIIDRLKSGMNKRVKPPGLKLRGVTHSETSSMMSPKSPFAPKKEFYYEEEEYKSKDSLGSNDELQVDCISRSSSGLFNLDKYWEAQGISLSI
jgi:hypothetical protein